MARTAAATRTANEIIKDSKIIDNRRESDTIRLWESHRDQALLWRSIALLQIPATCVLAILTLSIWWNSTIILNVPEKPLPGSYTPQQIPDSEYFNTATNFINLIASYQPSVSRRQFARAKEMLREPLLSRYDTEMMGAELRTIESTKRSQIYFVDPSKTVINREGDDVQVVMEGERLKIVAGKELPMVSTRATITMSTIPRNDLNPYGIVVTDISFENIER